MCLIINVILRHLQFRTIGNEGTVLMVWRQTVPGLVFGRMSGLLMGATALLVVLSSTVATQPSAAEREQAGLKESQRIDRSLRAFDDPVLVRMRTRVPPSWRGPRGAPPFTERRVCPTFFNSESMKFEFPDFC